MAKRKRATGGAAAAAAGRSQEDFRPGGSKLKINTYEDVANSEDEFHDNRDKIYFDNRDERRQQAMLDSRVELSDEEVLPSAEDGDDSDEAEFDDSDDEPGVGHGRAQDQLGSDTSSVDQDDDDDDAEPWGLTKKDYYGADRFETEQDEEDEENEAARIRDAKRRPKSDEALLREPQPTVMWNDTPNDLPGKSHEPLRFDDSITEQQNLDALYERHPEFAGLSDELQALNAAHSELSRAAESSVNTIKLQALSAYMGCLAVYFAIFSSPAAANTSYSIEDYPITDMIIRCRTAWQKAQLLEDVTDSTSESEMDVVEGEEALPAALTHPSDEPAPAKITASQKEKRSQNRERRNQNTTRALANLDARLAAAMKVSKPDFTPLTVDASVGGEERLTAHEAAEKERKKRSLRFYTSELAQKANRRANATIGGDDDVPRRERLRDRQERLSKAAEKRGQRANADSADLADRFSDDETDMTNQQREVAEQGSDGELEARMRAKKRSKVDREQAYQQAKAEGGHVVPHVRPGLNEDGRREIGWQIEKNKGLTPKRKKDVKNPRVKKRRKYEDKSKKLKSIKPVYQGGEGRGGYGGELTGIKKNLVKSTRL